MDFGYCDLSVVSVHTEASFSGEIATQLLFADAFAVLDRSGAFLRIRTAYDAYEGWIDGRQCAPLTLPDYDRLAGADRFVALDAFGAARALAPPHHEVLVVRGSSLPGLADGRFAVGGTDYEFTGAVVDTAAQVGVERVLEYARLFLNTPYMWGGKSPCGIDCSGFVQLAFKMAGMRLERDSNQQIQRGERVPNLASARVADLVFAQSPAGGHVGILLEDHCLLHASARVRVDRVTDDGIINVDTGEQSHWLTGIRRYLLPVDAVATS